MVKVVGYVVALGVLVAALFVPAWVLWDDDPAVAALRAGLAQPEPTTITDYDATFELSAEGDLLVVERLAVEFPPYDVRTGITRYFDRVDPSDERARRRVRDVSATLDGEAVPVEMSTAGHGRFDVATIGDPFLAVATGRHRIVVRYRVSGVLEPGYGGAASSLHWELLPASWPQDVERAELTVELPAPARDVQCGIGPDPSPLVCDDVSGQDTTTLVVTTGSLPDHTPVRVRLGLDTPPGPVAHLPWEPRYDVVLGQSQRTLGLVLGGALVAGVLGLLLARRVRARPWLGGSSEASPGSEGPVASGTAETAEEPPAGLGPAQTDYLLRGRVGPDALAATLAHAARHGAVDLTRRDDTWVLADRSSRFGWTGLDDVTARVVHLLGGPGAALVVDPSSAASGERVAAEVAALDSHTAEWARAHGLVETVRPSRSLALLVLLALAAAAAAAVWNPFDMSITGLVPGAFAVAALPLVRATGRPRLTPAGRALAGHAAALDRAQAVDGVSEIPGHLDPVPGPYADLAAAVDGARAAYDASQGGDAAGGRRRGGAGSRVGRRARRP